MEKMVKLVAPESKVQWAPMDHPDVLETLEYPVRLVYLVYKDLKDHVDLLETQV